MKNLNLFLIVTLLFATTSASHAVERDVSELQFNTYGWVWIPITLDDKVESFVGLRTTEIIGEIITAVWIQRAEDQSWESWGRSNQDQSKAIASVKSILELPDSTDSKWPIAPSTDPVEEPEKLTKGVLETDPFSPTVQALTNPSLFVLSLESVGWKTAWLDIWEFDCEDFRVLDVWSVAVDVSEYEIALNGGTNNLIQTTFDNTVSKPCGTDSYIRVIESHGMLALLSAGEFVSLMAKGVVQYSTGSPILLAQFTPLELGQSIIYGSLINTSSFPATFVNNNGTMIEIIPDEEVAVIDVYDSCNAQCLVVIGFRFYKELSAPIYGIDSNCFCCCWAALQPSPPMWLSTLPNCPCTINIGENGNPINPNPNAWDLENPAGQDYHPGASFCLRGCPTYDGGPAQQCCYDTTGNLITDGPGAGTPDATSPCGLFDLWDTWTHWEKDVHPFKHCNSAGMLDCYLLHRTPDNGNHCGCNPQTHPNCADTGFEYSCECD